MEKVQVLNRRDGSTYDLMPLDAAVNHLAKLLLGRTSHEARYEIEKRLKAGETLQTVAFRYYLPSVSKGE